MRFLIYFSLIAIPNVILAAGIPSILGSFRPDTRIVGGHNAIKGQFPHQISYQLSISNEWVHVCGGSIVTEIWIVTAGHCVTELPAGEVRVVAGILELSDEPGQISNVVKKVVHPKFKGKVNPNDIALLKLGKALKFNEVVKAIALPLLGDKQTVGKVVLSGWGSTSTTRVPINPTHLQTIDLQIISNTDCKNALDKVLVPNGQSNPFDGTSNICTGGLTTKTGACNGDSGGPLIQDGTLVGVVSWGIVPCGHEGAPSVFTRTASFLEFVNNTMNGASHFVTPFGSYGIYLYSLILMMIVVGTN